MPDNLPRFAALGLLALGAGACFKVPPNSASLSAMEATEVTASELQMRVYETGRRISTIIENTADTIIAYSSDPAAHRRALRWKLLATPLVEEASLRADPVVAGVDLWVFTMQLSDYLRRGNGRDAFGDLQPIALAAADTMEHLVAQLAARVRPDGKVSVADEQALRTWAERHPLQGSHMGRESILSSDWKTLSLTESSLTGTVASVQRSLTGVTNRLGYLNEGMFKRVLWQSELVARDVVPPLLAEGRAALLHDLSEQGGKLFGAVTEQRVADSRDAHRGAPGGTRCGTEGADRAVGRDARGAGHGARGGARRAYRNPRDGGQHRATLHRPRLGGRGPPRAMDLPGAAGARHSPRDPYGSTGRAPVTASPGST